MVGMWQWILFLIVVLAVPTWSAVLQVREFARALRAGELECPVRSRGSGKLEFAE